MPGLIVSADARVKAAFDPHIASLTLRPKTNDPTEGYHLAATAYFGSQNVEIPIDEGPDGTGREREVFEFRLELFQAEMVLEPANCDFDCMHEGDKSIERPIPVSKLGATDNRDISTKVKFDSGQVLEDLTGAKLGLERQVAGQKKKAPDAWFEVTIVDDKTIKFTSEGKKPVPLNGRLLDEFLGWRVVPKSGIPSGVLGRLRTRESWIELKDPRPVGRFGKWSEALLEVFKGKGPRYNFRRKAFNLLLSHLVARGLQEGAETRDATLAADTVIILPTLSDPTKLSDEPRAYSLDFDDHPIAVFLGYPVGQEKKALGQVGVPQKRIESLGLPPSADDDEEWVVGNSKPLDYLVEVHVDQVMSNIKRKETKWGLLKPVIAESILKGDPTQVISKNAAKVYGLLMTKSECEKLIEAVAAQPGIPTHFLSKKEDLIGLRNKKNLRYEVSFFELVAMLFGRSFASAYLGRNKARIESFISMYDENRRPW